MNRKVIWPSCGDRAGTLRIHKCILFAGLIYITTHLYYASNALQRRLNRPKRSSIAPKALQMHATGMAVAQLQGHPNLALE